MVNAFHRGLLFVGVVVETVVLFAEGNPLPEGKEAYVGMPRAVRLERLRNELQDLEFYPPAFTTKPGHAYCVDKLDFAMNAGLALTKGGRLWASWFAGGDSSGGYMVGVWSDDGGKTWTDTKFVVGSKDPILTLGVVDWTSAKVYLTTHIGNIWVAPDGSLRIYAYVSVNMFSDRGTLWEIVCHNPDADEPVWDSPPRYIGYGGHHNKPIVLRDGTWLLPNDFETTGNGLHPELEPFYGCGFFASMDGGRSWQRRGFARPDGTNHFAENMAVERADGVLHQFLRTGLGLMESTSCDGGFTWTKPSLTANLKQVIARFGYLRLENGHLVFIKNGVAPDVINKNVREKLSAYVSDDEGKTWKGGLMLDERSRVAYPDIFQASDGMIYVSYDHNRHSDKNGQRDEILFAKFAEEDILAGRLLNPASSLKNVIFRERDRQ